MRKKIVTLILAGCMLITLPAQASNLTDKKNELEDTQQQIEDAKQALEETQAEQVQVQKEIEALDSEIIGVENKVVEIEKNLAEQEQKVIQAEKDLADAIAKREAQYASTKDRMVEMYKNNKTGYVELIFTSDNLSELLNRSQYVKTISKYDNQLLDDYEEQEKVVEANKGLLEEQQAQIQVLYDEQIVIKEELAAARQAKNKRMGILETEEGHIHSNLAEFEEMSKQLEEEIKKLSAQSTGKYNGGAFAWPVPGYYRLSSEYNPREHPISGKWHFHQGIDVPAPYGVPVVAAADGKVVRAGWWGGFGNAVVIDHGSGIISIYGHNSSVLVSTGQTVTKGQQVAKIGSTGDSTGNHCHFEVRVNGQHTNPWNYLNK